MDLRKALVIDNIDEDEVGKVQLRILPEMKDIDVDKLPWCRPFLMPGGGGEGSTHDIPEIGEYVTVVIVDKYWINLEYIPSDYTIDNYPYSDFTSISSNITELDAQTYPQPKYIKKYADESFIFHNSETGEHGIYNSNGSYVLFDKNGDIFIYSNDEIKLYDKSGNSIEMTSTGVDINSGNLTVDI